MEFMPDAQVSELYTGVGVVQSLESVVRELCAENVRNLVGVEMVLGRRQPQSTVCIYGESFRPFLGPRLLQQLRPDPPHVWCTAASAQQEQP